MRRCAKTKQNLLRGLNVRGKLMLTSRLMKSLIEIPTRQPALPPRKNRKNVILIEKKRQKSFWENDLTE